MSALPDPATQTSPRSRRRAQPIRTANRPTWDEWYAWFSREWLQDEHVSLIGTTGTGKSALSVALLDIRLYKVYVINKPADEKLEKALLRKNYIQVPAFPKRPPDDIDKYLLWPPGSGQITDDGRKKQRAVMRDAFEKIFHGPPGGKPGRWCVCIDEARYVSDPKLLGLSRELTQILIQGRSIRMSLMLNFQRPSWVPPEAYDQASHLFIANDNDRRNVQRFREIGGVDGETLAIVVQNLKQFEWAHVDARPGKGDINIIKMPKGL